MAANTSYDPEPKRTHALYNFYDLFRTRYTLARIAFIRLQSVVHQTAHEDGCNADRGCCTTVRVVTLDLHWQLYVSVTCVVL